MNTKHIRILVLAVFLFALFLMPNLADAADCGARSAIGNTPPYWGSSANQDVNSSSGSQARVSVRGEDGCAGQAATFQIKQNNSVVSTINLTLNQGPAVAGQEDVYTLFSDWSINLSNGNYKIQLISVGGQIFQSSQSSNTLIVGVSQACSLSSVYATPNGGRPGDRVQLTVNAQGSCQGESASIVVNNTTGGGRRLVFTGASQTFSSFSNRLQWGWDLPALSPGAAQATYRIMATLGSQTQESPAFVVSSDGGGGESCNNDGICDPGETSVTCPTDCQIAPGSTVSFDFEIDNPLQSNNLIELIDVIATWLLNIAIPIAVAMIVYAGVIFLISKGEPVKVNQAKQILLYAVVGLAIILIGKGFITLIESILNLGTSPGP